MRQKRGVAEKVKMTEGAPVLLRKRLVFDR